MNEGLDKVIECSPIRPNSVSPILNVSSIAISSFLICISLHI